MTKRNYEQEAIALVESKGLKVERVSPQPGTTTQQVVVTTSGKTFLYEGLIRSLSPLVEAEEEGFTDSTGRFHPGTTDAKGTFRPAAQPFDKAGQDKNEKIWDDMKRRKAERDAKKGEQTDESWKEIDPEYTIQPGATPDVVEFQDNEGNVKLSINVDELKMLVRDLEELDQRNVD